MPEPVPRFPPLPQLVGGAPIYLTGEDALRLEVLNAAAGVTVALTGRFLAAARFPDEPPPVVQPFAHPLVPATTRTLTTRIETLGDGWLLDWAVVVTAGAPLYGQTFAMLSIVRGKPGGVQDASALGQGYVTARQRIGGLSPNFAASVDGPGAVRSVTGSTPAAGAEISETVPAGARWQLIAIAFNLVTAVAAGNRIVHLLLDDGANVYFRDSPNVLQAASLTDNYSFAAGESKLAAVSANAVMGNVPVENRLPAGHRIRTSTNVIQGADQFSAPQLLVREWLEAAA